VDTRLAPFSQRFFPVNNRPAGRINPSASSLPPKGKRGAAGNKRAPCAGAVTVKTTLVSGPLLLGVTEHWVPARLDDTVQVRLTASEKPLAMALICRVLVAELP
jgi:hypothetical protein